MRFVRAPYVADPNVEMEIGMEFLEERVAPSEARTYASDMVIDFLYHQVAQLLAMLVVFLVSASIKDY